MGGAWTVGVVGAVAGMNLGACAQPAAGVKGGDAPTTAITIYSTATPGAIPAEMYRPTAGSQYGPGYQWQIPGYALVRQDRAIEVGKGRSTVKFTDVAALIEPTTVSFTSMTDPKGTRVLEQSFQFDLVNNQRLLERFIDKPITVEQVMGDKAQTISGTLMSASGGLILRGADGQVKVVNSYSSISFPALPEGLITRPTLVWDVISGQGGKQTARVTYQTGGITWWADYNLVFSEGKDANSGVLDLGAWVSILNKSGAGYPEARLKLIAGDVHRAPTQGPMSGPAGAMRAAAADESKLGFEEKSFFEYHLYTLGRPASIPDNSTKQIELFDKAMGVACDKVMVYYGAEGFQGFFPTPMVDRNYMPQGNKKVDLYLRFKNSKENRLGMPLPSGRIRVSKLDAADGSLEFIGEDVIDHTPKDETVLIKLGSAFDVVGERKQVDFKVDERGHWMDETIEVAIRNHKNEPVNVIVKENLYRWVNWEIKARSHEFEKMDARTVHFPVKVEKDGEAVVRYTVHYTW